MSAQELVSVVIPVYNGAKFLAEAIRSVESQRHPRIEIIVVDDGSSDGSGDVARSFSEVRCLRQANRGIAAARNAGVQQVRGSLLAFLDADDLWTANKLSLQLEMLSSLPQGSFVSGSVEQFYESSLAPASAEQPTVLSTVSAGTILIRTQDFLRVGLFDPALRVGEFIDWHSRAVHLGLREHRVDEIVLLRRIHGENTGLQRRDCSGDYLTMLKAHLDRKRRAA